MFMNWNRSAAGQTTKMNKLHYRASSALIERIKISKLMLIEENSLVGKFAGRKLSDIQFEGESY